VTAHVSLSGSPVAGQTVVFTVTGVNAGATGTCVPAACTTDATGNVTFTYSDTKGVGDDTITASFTSSGTTEQATAVKHWVTGVTDATPPSCALTGVVAGPPKQIQITAQDTDGGLGSITVTTSVNATVAVPAFTTGTTAPVVVTATKIDQSTSAEVALTVTDVAGNVTDCDPVITELVRDSGRADAQSFSGITQAEHLVTIVNDSPGLRNLGVDVNGRKVTRVHLVDGQTVTLDLGSAMRPGSHNTITLTATGGSGGTATVVIHD
jgi:hypothetical protein